eukprot:CAMPEP_0173402470 /NCGR_PEP_ID=MMETSP1356-20130122/54022_1 /TAXON_ID=77927 ORGANISM="Hemiselmis virescens, Strain PCC157" /NCGR_SAMPLE_ID=MMETSP1356 /ASSEMBLY_ACC=CAM_ASM_000847 /LENGTH=262 /DNA_ID=CAMNT_0014362809 /DNA_START=29 /DNA_END=814 /DNA_ORIENTATION=-
MVVVYVICSSCMLVVNKASLQALPFSYTVTMLQTGASALLLLLARSLGAVSFPNPTVRVMRDWSGILVVWVVPILLNMNAVSRVTVETMMMFRSVTVVAVALGDTLLLGSKQGAREISACILISLGGIIYAWNDLHFDLVGYTWGLLYSVSMIVNSIYVKSAFEKQKHISVWEKTFLNNALGTPIVIAIALWREDMAEVVSQSRGLTVWGAAAVLASCFMGLGISMSGVACRSVLSATSFDVLGNCTKYLTLAISALMGSTN